MFNHSFDSSGLFIYLFYFFLQILQRCPKAVYELMLKCWHPVASKRPTSTEVRATFARIRNNEDLKNETVVKKEEELAMQNMYK